MAGVQRGAASTACTKAHVLAALNPPVARTCHTARPSTMWTGTASATPRTYSSCSLRPGRSERCSNGWQSAMGTCPSGLQVCGQRGRARPWDVGGERALQCGWRGAVDGALGRGERTWGKAMGSEQGACTAGGEGQWMGHLGEGALVYTLNPERGSGRGDRRGEGKAMGSGWAVCTTGSGSGCHRELLRLLKVSGPFNLLAQHVKRQRAHAAGLVSVKV